MAEDVPLSGGNSAANVVRNGDTVRKPPTPFDAATTALLNRLADAGVHGVPKALGTDDQGRRMLSWVAGESAFPSDIWTSDTALISAAQHLRVIHDASVALVGVQADWAYRYPDPSQHQVICHNDFAPYNMTFDEAGAVVGVFDFDLAGPGPRLRDVAYLCWWMVPLGRQDPNMKPAADRDLAGGCLRLQSLCAAYGIAADLALLDMIAHVLDHMSDPEIAKAMIGPEAATRLTEGGHFDHWAKAAADFARLRPQIAANLGR